MAGNITTERSNWLLIVDCDGVLTGYKTFFSSEGKLFKVFNSRDSYAIKSLKSDAHNLVIVISDTEAIDITKARAKSWGIEVYGAKNKLPVVKDIIKYEDYDVVAVVGNSSKDYICAKEVDYFFAPGDARIGYKDIDNLVLLERIGGGEGVLEEIEKYIMKESA